MTRAAVTSPTLGVQYSGRGGREINKSQELLVRQAATVHAVAASKQRPASRQNKLPMSLISKEPNRCGGDACIRDHRIPVWVLENYRRRGASDACILNAYPSLTSSDLQMVWEY